MSRGGQDWVGRIDLLRQTLDYLETRDKIIAFTSAGSEFPIDWTGSSSIAGVNAKGHLFSAYITVYGCPDNYSGAPYLLIDDFFYFSLPFQFIFEHSLHGSSFFPGNLTHYDRQNGIYTVYFQTKIPFEHSIEIGFDANVAEGTLKYEFNCVLV